MQMPSPSSLLTKPPPTKSFTLCCQSRLPIPYVYLPSVRVPRCPSSTTPTATPPPATNPIYDIHRPPKASHSLSTWLPIACFPIDGNNLPACHSSVECAFPYIYPSHKPYNNSVHHIPSPVPRHFRHSLRHPWPKTNLPHHSYPLPPRGFGSSTQ